jgi:hypothetical protein
MTTPRPLGVRRAITNSARIIKHLTRWDTVRPTVAWNPSYLLGLRATLAAPLAPPKHGARPGWPRPCFVSRPPLAAIACPTFLRRAPSWRAKKRGYMETIDEKTKDSSFIENIVEHTFISELMQEAWLSKKKKLEILRSEVDDSGYDLVISYDKINRYIQLKTSDNSKTSNQKMNIKILGKQNPCIIWILRDSTSNRYKFSYLYYGSKIEEEFPDISLLKVAKHTKGNAEGIKNERVNIREIPKSKFIKIKNEKELLKVLFAI